MRAVQLENDVVVNAIIVDELPDGFIESDTANIGDTHSDGVFTAPVTGPVFTTEQILANNRLDKVQGIKQAVGYAIVAGITSNVLGQPYYYPTTRDDQANLNGLITESLLPGSGDYYKFWCADNNAVWARRPHTKIQIQSVGKAVSDHVKYQQEKYVQKLADIAAATTLSELEAITW